MMAFEDDDNKVIIYDLTNECIRATTDILRKVPLNKIVIKGEDVTHSTAWCITSKHIIIQTEEEIIINPMPYLSYECSNSTFMRKGFESLTGIFIPIIGGGPTYSSAGFGTMFDKAFEQRDLETLKTPIYPYRMNSLHWFALSGNNEAIEYCIQNGVKFMYDIFGTNPLYFAIKSSDLTSINSIYKGLLKIDSDKAVEILQQIPINFIMSENVPDLGKLLCRLGTSVPESQKFHEELKVPKNYVIPKDKIVYS